MKHRGPKITERIHRGAAAYLDRLARFGVLPVTRVDNRRALKLKRLKRREEKRRSRSLAEWAARIAKGMRRTKRQKKEVVT